jgi:lysophospholipase L1-like esterase
MIFIFGLVVCGTLSAWAREPAPAFALHDGDRVVFYGDSITQDGGYARLVEEYTRSRHPTWDLRFYNAGVGGDTTKGGWAGALAVRLERDVVRLNPTVVTIMLGMNDGGYQKLSPETLSGFTERLRAMVVELKTALPAARLYLIRSSPFDDISRPPNFDPGYDHVLRQLGNAVTVVGREQHAAVIDFGRWVDDGIKAVFVEDRALARQILPDRVHPGPAGHLVMGATLLRAWQAPALVARIAIDAKRGAVVEAENAVVSALAVADGKITWDELDYSLPLPLGWEDADTELAQKAGANLEALDDEPLIISGLRLGRYELRIDEQLVGAFTSAELARGVNLARYNTPMRWQAYQVRWGAENGNQLQRVRRELLVAAAGSPALGAAAESLATRDESQQKASSLAVQPQQRHYVVSLVP